jgi:hypothetical protein
MIHWPAVEAVGWVAGGAVADGTGAAWTSRVAETPMLPPPQRPLTV